MFDINHNVVIEGQYSIKGKIMVLPIVGNGKCNITLGKKIILQLFFEYEIF
jgi:Haemolymph juvenile hormone binding protein (JHBP).